MPRANEKGARREREVINRLASADWYPMKSPASGSATDRELPDLIAGTGTARIAAEVKTANPDNGNIYIDAEKIDDLYLFARAFDMAAVVFVRWDNDTTWYWAEPSDIPVTDTGNYRVDPTSCTEDWRVLGDLRSVMEDAPDLF